MTGFKRRERLELAFEAAGLPLPVPKEVLEAVRACERRAIVLHAVAAGDKSPGVRECDLELDGAEVEQLKAEFFDDEPRISGHSGEGDQGLQGPSH